MAKKIKVYELAKELNTTGKNLLEKIIGIGIDVKSHMSTLEDEQLEKIYDYFGMRKKEEVKDKKETINKQVIKTQENTEQKEKPKRSGPRIVRTAVREIRTDEQTGITTEFVTEIKGAERKRTSKIIEEPKEHKTKQEIFESMNPHVKIKKEQKSMTESKPIIKPKIVEEKITEHKVKKEEKPTEKVIEKRVEKEEPVKKNYPPKQYQKPEKYNKPKYENTNKANNKPKYENKRKEEKMPVLQERKPMNSQTRHAEKNEEFITKAPSRKGITNKEIDKRKTQEREATVFNKNKQVVEKDTKYDKFKKLSHSHASELLNNDSILDINDRRYDRKKIKKTKNFNEQNKMIKQEPIKVVLKVTIPEIITVKSLSERMKKQAAQIIKKLFDYGIIATLNQEIDYDTAATIAIDMGYIVEKEIIVNEEDILFDNSEDKEEELEPRAPVVVVMGHVDHGKTSLLDAIRSTNSIDKEAGGITQHIGAYNVRINDKKIAFLDTPGHEAFTAMRARGAQVTDIAILVVAADDGVKPQTIEAINHAKAANISIIVAINKIDKPEANPEKVKQQLMEYGLVAEEWGGDTIFVPVSAKKREGIDQLLEIVLLVADMLDLKANPNKQAKGTVIESKLDKGRGPVATVLVQRGTLKTGDVIVTGQIMGKVRAMSNDKMQKIKKAGPSTPVEIIGLPDIPDAGEIFYVVENEKIAKHLVEKRRVKQRELAIHKNRVTLDDLFDQIQQGEMKNLNIIVKADVQGSVEAIKQSLEKISNEEVKVKVIHGGVGAITESDVMLASVSNAIIIGFNVRPEISARTVAERDDVDIKLYSIIYEAIDAVKAAIKGMQAPKFHEVIYGHAQVRQIFKISGNSIAGCYVTDGKILRNSSVRILRENVVIFTGSIDQLKRFKDDVKEIATGYECGITVDNFNDFKEEDIIEAFGQEENKVE